MTGIGAYRYLIARRMMQVGILMCFWLGAHMHVGLLTGNLSASRVLRTVPLADPDAALQLLAAGGTLGATVLLGAAIVLLFYLVVGGRAFCGWVCPINPVTDLARWLKRRRGTRGGLGVARRTRYWIGALALFLSAVMGLAAFEAVSPIGMVHRELIFAPGLGLLAAAGILGLDLVLRHGWCGSLCPLGAFWSVVGRWSLVRVGFEEARCDRCGECTPVCPEPQVIRFSEMSKRGFIDSGNCLNCGRCLEICPRDAYRFALRFDPRLHAAG
jgi:ferredoxin-type protein NapH